MTHSMFPIFSAAAGALALAFASLAAASDRNPPVRVDVYRGASVWTGEGFSPRDVVVGGRRVLQGVPAGGEVRLIDVSGKFIVPPLGSAHEHSVNPSPRYDWAYFSDGVYYLWNANSIVTDQETADYYRRDDTADVATAMGGITEPGGHPEPLYTETLSKFLYRGWRQEDFLNNAFHYGRTPAEIDNALDRLLAQGADFVKTFLLFCEEYDKRRDDPAFRRLRGLNPANFAYLAAAAKRRGLPVYVHVETAADMMVAVRGGASVLGHLPGYASDPGPTLAAKALSPEQAREAGRSKVMFVPTYIVARTAYDRAANEPGFDARNRDATFRVQGANLRMLHEAGATILTGTDLSKSVADELQHWVDIGAMSKFEALKAGLATGKAMFPQRKLGCFDAGCEADFLVLKSDPSENLSALRSIDKWVKGGRQLTPPATDSASSQQQSR